MRKAVYSTQTISFSFYFFFVFIRALFIYFFNFILFLPNIKMNPPQVYMCSPSCTLLPPPSPHHPSGSSQCTSPKHPVSCIEPGLATRFIHDILPVSMPFSQIFKPFLFKAVQLKCDHCLTINKSESKVFLLSPLIPLHSAPGWSTHSQHKEAVFHNLKQIKRKPSKLD